MTLVDRLRAAIEERKVLAEVLDGESWTAVHDCGGDSYISQGCSSGIGRDEDSSGADFGLLDPAEANLMETNSPSAVLRRCKADLWILHELAAPSHCDDCTDGGDSAGTIHECPVDGVKRTVIRLLAEGYGITEEPRPSDALPQ